MTSPADADADASARLRRVRLDRARALFERLRRIDGVTAPEALAMEDAVLAALARDRELYSDVLEPSFTLSPEAEHAYRFSYAFPGFRARDSGALSPEGSVLAVRSALACAAPFGPAITAATRRLLRAATEPVVAQPLIGVAWDGPGGAPRHKVYLQFRDDAGPAAGALVERLLARPGLERSLGDASVHMLGVDFGPAGLLGAKVYVAHARVASSEDPGATPLSRALASLAGGPRMFRNALAIHRITSASPPGVLPAASDVDVGLADNELAWEDVARAPGFADLVARSRVAVDLFSSFRLEVRRVSVAVGVARRGSVYYGLREVEEP